MPTDPERMLRVSPVMAVPAILDSMGHDSQAVLDRAGVSRALLSHPDNLIDMNDLGRLVSLCVEVTGCAHFGLVVAKAAGPYVLGPVTPLMLAAQSVHAALRNVVRYLHHHDRSAVAYLDAAGDQAIFGYEVQMPDLPALSVVHDGSIGVAFMIMQHLCGPGWRPAEVVLSRRAPADPSVYRAFFGTKVQFNMQHDALVFPVKDLSRKVVAVPAAEMPALPPEIDVVLPFVEQVRRALSAALPLGPVVGVDIARDCGVSRRTMDWRLAEAGVSFGDLKNAARRARACRLMRVSDAPLADIGLAVGFADASAFSRAFRAWTGMPPQAWRDASSEE